MLVLRLIPKRLEPLGDSLLGQRTDPKSLNRHTAARFLIDPTLNQLAFLPRITAVDDLIGTGNQPLDDIELLLYPRIAADLNRETVGNHRQRTEAPVLPLVGVLLWVEQGTEMPEDPCNTIAVALHIAFTAYGSPQHGGYRLPHRGFLGYTDNHKRVLLK